MRLLRLTALWSVLAVAWVVHPVAALAAPAVTSLTPSYGVVGTPVTVTGSGFTGVGSVMFGGTPATFTVSPDGTRISTSVPAGAVTGPIVLDGAAGPVFTVTQPVSLAVRAPAKVTYPTAASLVATLSLPGGMPVGGEPVELWARSAGAAQWTRLGSATTGSTGAVTFSHVPNRLTTYHVEHRADRAFTAALASATVAVAPRVTLTLPAMATINVANSLTGAVTPARPGATVWLWRSTSTGWHSERAAVLDSASHYRFSSTWRTVGSYVYKVVLPADATHATGASSARTLQVFPPRLWVRDLSSGMSGADVADLQRRLAAAHYDPGAADGNFGYSTVHAVLAFQKVEGLARTGVMNQVSQEHLMRPATARLLHPVSGASVEVNLTRQVLYYAVNGAAQRILDISSGSGQYYSENGSSGWAITPTGAFHVYRKVNAWDKSPLGMLYRPAYFYGGYAIHGSDSVPTYPASHGCIRITNPAMDRLYDKLTIGLPVWVYRS